MFDSLTVPQLSDDELFALADRPMLWANNVDGVFKNLRAALVHTAAVSARGRTPYKLNRMADPEITIDHFQMPRLWRLLGIVAG
jgi:hypothetical protein